MGNTSLGNFFFQKLKLFDSIKIDSMNFYLQYKQAYLLAMTKKKKETDSNLAITYSS